MPLNKKGMPQKASDPLFKTTPIDSMTVWAHLGSNQGPTDYESVALTD